MELLAIGGETDDLDFKETLDLSHNKAVLGARYRHVVATPAVVVDLPCAVWVGGYRLVPVGGAGNNADVAYRAGKIVSGHKDVVLGTAPLVLGGHRIQASAVRAGSEQYLALTRQRTTGVHFEPKSAAQVGDTLN